MAALLSLDIGTNVYNNVISRSYSWHIKNNTSLVLGLLSNDVEKVRESINNFFALLINIVNKQIKLLKLENNLVLKKQIVLN